MLDTRFERVEGIHDRVFCDTGEGAGEEMDGDGGSGRERFVVIFMVGCGH
jgi:hypothetical protein